MRKRVVKYKDVLYDFVKLAVIKWHLNDISEKRTTADNGKEQAKFGTPRAEQKSQLTYQLILDYQ